MLCGDTFTCGGPSPPQSASRIARSAALRCSPSSRSTNMIPSSRLELSYNLVDAADDNIIRAPTSPTVPGRLRDGYQLSNSGYAQSNTTHTVSGRPLA